MTSRTEKAAARTGLEPFCTGHGRGVWRPVDSRTGHLLLEAGHLTYQGYLCLPDTVVEKVTVIQSFFLLSETRGKSLKLNQYFRRGYGRKSSSHGSWGINPGL